MPNWIPITIETLNEARVAKAVQAYSTKVKASGQPDRAPGIIQGVVDTVRRKIASNPKNTVDSDESKIPKGLRDLVVDMILIRLKRAVLMKLDEDERRTLDRCESDLNRIADGKDTVEQPDIAVESPAQATSPAPSIKARPSQFSRAAQEGI